MTNPGPADGNRSASAAHRFDDIQALRFFAALCVLLYHAQTYLGRMATPTSLTAFFGPKFAWGVYLFFVISGFVLSHALTSTRPSLFLAHRFLRIYPAYWLSVAMAITIQFAMTGQANQESLTPGILLLLPIGEASYPLGIEWTLIYEMMFYFVMTLVGCLSFRNSRETVMLIWLLLIFFADHQRQSYWTVFLPNLSQVFLSGFNLPFIAGVLAYSFYERNIRIPTVLLLSLFLLGLVLAAHLAKTEYQLAAQGFAFAAFALVIAAAQHNRKGRSVARIWLVRMGNHSYALYLVHVQILVFMLSQLIPRYGDSLNVIFISAILTALLIGSLWGKLETSMYRHLKRGFDSRTQTFRTR